MTPPEHHLGRDRRSQPRRGNERRGPGLDWAGRDRRAGIDRRKHQHGGRPEPWEAGQRPRGAAPRTYGSIRREALAAGAVALAGTLALAEVLIARHAVVPAAVEELARGAAVWHGGTGSLEEIGYDRPPLLAIAHVALTVSRDAASTLVLLPVPTALIAAVLVAALYGVLGRAGLSGPWRVAGTAAVALNPVALYAAAAGLPVMFGAAAVVAAFYGLLCWLRHGGLRWLVVAAASLAAGVLAWYPVVCFAAVAAVVVVGRLVTARRPAAEVAGTLALLVAPTVFLAGVWTIVVWRRSGELVGWLDAGAAGSGLAASDASFALLIAPVAVAVALALGAAARRAPGAGWVALAIVTPVGAVLALRLRTDGAAAETGTVVLLALPAAALLIAAVLHRDAGRLTLGAVIALLLAADAGAAVWMGREAPQPTARAIPAVLTGGAVAATPADQRDVTLAVARRHDDPVARGRTTAVLLAPATSWHQPFRPAPGPWSPRRIFVP